MSEPAGEQAVFVPDGDQLVPTQLAGGPWSPDALHGGAAAGLLARTLEPLVPGGMRVTRLAVDLRGEVPFAPLRATAERVRPGRRVGVVCARLEAGARVVASATAQLIRTEPVAGVARWVAEPRPHATDPEAGRRPEWTGVERPGFARAVEFTAHGQEGTGGHVMWTRLLRPLVAGEAPSPFVRLCALSDFASGSGNDLDFTRFASINPDLTLHIDRVPEGEWIGIEGSTDIAGDGTGQSLASLYDRRGRVARALASLYVAARPGAPEGP